MHSQVHNSTPIGNDLMSLQYAANPTPSSEHFSIVPTSFQPFETIVVSPIFAEEYHVRPPVYDLYINRPRQDAPYKQINKIEDPRDFPYGQYLTTTNLLPGDEKKLSLYCNSKSKALGYVNSVFVMNDIAFRENMSRILLKKIKRRERHTNCNDSYSPYFSY
jgi:hypothetical protein